VTSKKQYNRTV